MGDMRDDKIVPSQQAFENILPVFTTAEIDLLGSTSRLEEASDDASEQAARASEPYGVEITERGVSTVDPRLIEWLATTPQAAACICRRGLRIYGASIPGGIDLAYADVPFPLEFSNCEICGALNVEKAHIPGLRLVKTSLKGILGDGSVIGGDLTFGDGSKSSGPIHLRNVVVGGNADFTAASLNGGSRGALLADGLCVQGDLVLGEKLQAKGLVSFIGAVIDGDLLCIGAQLNNPKSIAFNADRARIGGVAKFDQNYTAVGETRLMGATVKRDLIFEDARLSITNDKTLRRKRCALQAQHLDVGGSLRLRNGFSAEGEVSLLRSVISKSFDCSKGTFKNPDGIAINADGISVHDVYFVNGFEAHGQVRVLGARVSGDLACVRGTFNGCIDTTTNSPGKIALAADGARIEGSVYLRHLKANGGVRLVGTRIGLSLECDAADIANSNGIALNAQGAEIGGNALFRDGFHAEGSVCLYGASIKRFLSWQDIENPCDAVLDLREASAGILGDDSASWPSKGNLKLRGFRCRQLSGSAPTTARERIRWVKLQPTSEWQSQTYEWLARSFRESGDHHGANKLLTEKNNEILRSGSPNRRTKTRLRLWKVWNGYGYKPWRVGIWTFLLLIVSCFLFAGAGREGLFVPTAGLSTASITPGAHGSDDPSFRPIWYTVDSFVPFVDLDQLEAWSVDLNASRQLFDRIRLTGGFVNGYRYILSIIGWILTAYFASRWVAALARRL